MGQLLLVLLCVSAFDIYSTNAETALNKTSVPIILSEVSPTLFFEYSSKLRKIKMSLRSCTDEAQQESFEPLIRKVDLIIRNCLTVLKESLNWGSLGYSAKSKALMTDVYVLTTDCLFATLDFSKLDRCERKWINQFTKTLNKARLFFKKFF